MSAPRKFKAPRCDLKDGLNSRYRSAALKYTIYHTEEWLRPAHRPIPIVQGSTNIQIHGLTLHFDAINLDYELVTTRHFNEFYCC